jgi:hypothetical protein
MGLFGNLPITNITPQVSGFRVKAINEGRHHGSRHPPSGTIVAGIDQAPAVAFFLNPEP